jgi:hypothetical protein
MNNTYIDTHKPDIRNNIRSKQQMVTKTYYIKKPSETFRNRTREEHSKEKHNTPTPVSTQISNHTTYKEFPIHEF